MTTLSQAEAEKIFNQTSKAISASDTNKLSELMTHEEEEQEQEVPEKEEVVELDDKSTSNDTTTQEQKEEESTTPSEETQAEVVEEEKIEEPAELKELKEQLAKVRKENHNLKSQAGRVPFVQRQVTELTKKLEELQKNASTPSNLPSAKLAPKLQEKLKKIGDTDPELADVIAQAISAASDEVAADNFARNQDTLTTLRDLQMAEQREHQMSLLLDDYPNAIDVFKSESWQKWKQEQSEAVKQLAGSGMARDVSLAFELYAKDLVAKNPELATSVETAQQNTQASKVEESRQKRQAASVNVQTKTAPAQVKMPDDPELLFKQMYEQTQKQRLGR